MSKFIATVVTNEEGVIGVGNWNTQIFESLEDVKDAVADWLEEMDRETAESVVDTIKFYKLEEANKEGGDKA